MSELKVLLEFSGGAELLFGNTKKQEITLPPQDTWTVEMLLVWIKVCSSAWLCCDIPSAYSDGGFYHYTHEHSDFSQKNPHECS